MRKQTTLTDPIRYITIEVKIPAVKQLKCGLEMVQGTDHYDEQTEIYSFQTSTLSAN